MTAFLNLGKYGDIISSLPIAYHRFKQTGIKPVFITSRQFGDILFRAPYVQGEFFDGGWYDLEAALKQAKKKYSKVVCLQTFGKEFPIHQYQHSFQLEQYDRAGVLDLWDKLPLIMEEDSEASRAMMKSVNGSRFVLFGDHSQSSPFLQKDELFDMVQDYLNLQSPYRKLVRMSQMKMPSLCDFIPLYNRADAIIAVDSAHLHLSKTSKTPVLALATDKPTRWHGASWSKRFSFYCRYGEFDSRKHELIQALDGVLNGARKLEIVRMG